ncbi:unnamed protein product [Ilex paraguariensis]|uniref:DUF632 domain-containing protein n=1 Tax=Ilex paraguariensis TaxID=185542 RepID=A0ABC8T607_9AQUA
MVQEKTVVKLGSILDITKAKMKSNLSPLYRHPKVLEEAERERQAVGCSRENVAGKSGGGATVKKAATPQRMERKVSEDINQSAEAFIRKFRQELVIQRLDSIENYEKMLARGT